MYMYRFILRFRCLDFVKCKVQLISTNGKTTRNYLTHTFCKSQIRELSSCFFIVAIS